MIKTDTWETRPHVREGAPKKDKTVTLKKKNSGQKSQIGLDTKTYWLTDRQTQCDFDFDFLVSLSQSRQIAIYLKLSH
jgi:hypothetical protein